LQGEFPPSLPLAKHEAAGLPPRTHSRMASTVLRANALRACVASFRAVRRTAGIMLVEWTTLLAPIPMMTLSALVRIFAAVLPATALDLKPRLDRPGIAGPAVRCGVRAAPGCAPSLSPWPHQSPPRGPPAPSACSTSCPAIGPGLTFLLCDKAQRHRLRRRVAAPPCSSRPPGTSAAACRLFCRRSPSSDATGPKPPWRDHRPNGAGPPRCARFLGANVPRQVNRSTHITCLSDLKYVLRAGACGSTGRVGVHRSEGI